MESTRIKVPSIAKRGTAVEIRAMIMHPMENGFNFDTQGATIPVHIITDFICRYMDEDVVRVKLEPGLAANPYFSFYLEVQQSSEVQFEWHDQDGRVTRESATIQVA
jgi:sulfur-oxidizing protein SoxZ